MQHSSGRDEGLALRQLAKRVAQWRGSRRRRSPMPEDLWTEATALAVTCGVGPVATEAGLDRRSLGDRVEQFLGDAQEDESQESQRAFVEVRGVELMSDLGGGAVVEVSDGGGRQLTIRVQPDSRLDVPGVVSAFLGRDR